MPGFCLGVQPAAAEVRCIHLRSDKTTPKILVFRQNHVWNGNGLPCFTQFYSEKPMKTRPILV
jgi:hypothetical protein